jgi:hypothetical protein
MITKANRTAKTPRTIALLAAALLLVGQFAATVHWHSTSLEDCASVSAGFSSDGGLCALCLFHFHSPGTIAVVPALTAPTFPQNSVSYIASAEPLIAHAPCLFGRAPPVSV